jgi:hypothetical protein
MGLTHSPRIVTDGLVFCVDAANTRSYPGTGTTWTDLKGSNNGTLTNGPTFTSDNRGAIVFDGSNDYVELIATGSEYNFSNISVGCWFKTSTTSSQPTTLVSKMSNVIASLNGWDLTIAASNGNLTWSPKFNAGITSVATGDYRDGNWHYAVGTHDGTDARIYVDGVLKATASNSNTSNSSLSVFIGAWGVTATLAYYSEANIASVHIYNKTLDDSEVLQNYLATKGRYE